jgi:hypothetical protein
MGDRLKQRQALQPRPRTRLEAQAARRVGHGACGAAQDTQALLVEIMKSRTVGVRRNSKHAEIVKAGGDVVVSVWWQLHDSVAAMTFIAARAGFTWATGLKHPKTSQKTGISGTCIH